MNILVTGGAGYIGSHTCKELQRHGYTPIVLDNLTTGHAWAVKWGPLVKGSIQDQELVRSLLINKKISAVIHFAGSSLVGKSGTDPQKYYENNVVNSLIFLNTLKDVGVKKIVFSSTAAVYGNPLTSIIDETHPLSPINTYGETKRVVEKALDFYKTYGFKSIALRYFNACGASLDGEIGEAHNPETHLIPLAIRSAFENNYVLNLFGNDYSTADGTCVRDYIHVDDIANAHISALNKLIGVGEANGAFDCINLGTSKGCSVMEIIDSIGRLSGKNVNCRIGARRNGDPETLVASNEKAKTLLDWTPKKSDLNTIISSAIKWHEHYSKDF